MRLTTARVDRAAGVLLASAAGDALGVPYEFSTPPGSGELAEMRGGGLGRFAPGEWSDGTSMAAAVARVAATGADLASDAALDAIAEAFLEWYDAGRADIGVQTSAVLGATRRAVEGGGRAGEVMALQAAAYSASRPRSAGNGALMRTAPVALADLGDRVHLADAARKVASLSHADPLAGDSCVQWREAIRVALLEARVDVRRGLDLLPKDRRREWSVWLDEASGAPSGQFRPNGFTVTALQAAVAAIAETPARECRQLQETLHAAVRVGDDTDTVAAVAGALLGAWWGASAVPWRWRRALHGWPGLDGRDLVSLATLTVRGGRPDGKGWPVVDEVQYDEPAASVAVPHPHDDGVLLGTHRSRGHGADAVVALCRVGRSQACFEGAAEVVESRLLDSEAPDDNPNLAFTLYDTVDAVQGLRAEGRTVLLHCVAAHQRRPSVAVAYSVLLGHEVAQARRVVLGVLNDARGRGAVWNAVDQVSTMGSVH